ncbi:uncharacterized protein LOC111111549 [Crassostrea virginica]
MYLYLTKLKRMDVFSRDVGTGFQHLCESVFVGLCQIIGTSVQVAIRRETVDISEMVRKQLADNDDYILMESGSMREGFRLEGSDMDFMFWQNDKKVIWNMSQSEYYYTANKTLILSDSSESPPGFTLLELLTSTTDEKIESACVPMNGRLYIASSLFRKSMLSHVFPDSTEHGPCESGEMPGGIEYDLAFCFAKPIRNSWA